MLGGAAARDDVRSVVDAILGELLGDLDDLADRGTAAIRAGIPAYVDREDAFFSDVRDQVRRHYGVQLAALLEEREVTAEEIAFTRSAAMRRARSGVALEDYVTGFRIGMEVLWAEVTDRAPRTPEGHEAALALVQPLMAYANFAATHASNTYVEFQRHAEADADRARRDLLECLLAGRLPERGPLRSAAAGFGLGEDARALVAVAVPAAPECGDEVPTGASASIARTALGDRPALVLARQSEIVAVVALDPLDAATVCERLERAQARLTREGMPLAMGISAVAVGVRELPRAYEEARRALAGVADEGVAALPLLTPFAYLARGADATARRLVDDRVRAFLDEDRGRGGVLTATVRAFADADMNVRVAATRLDVHPNTVQYRIGRIEARTGRALRRVEDLFALLVAIELDVGP